MREIDAATMQQAAGMGVGAMVFMALLWLFLIVAMWKVYTKAGQPGWAVLIPIYNMVVLLQIVRKPLWWFVMFLIPFVNIIFLILVNIELAKAYGKGGGFAAGLIFLGPIFIAILGFGGAQYVYGPATSQAVQTA
jgi:hypothetical protein